MKLTYPLLCLLTLLLTSLSAAEYHVRPDGSDENDGSQTTPFRSIQKGVSVLEPGDTLLVHPGRYDRVEDAADSVWNYILLNRSGTPDKPITVRGLKDKDGKRPLVVSPCIGTFCFHDASNIILEGFEMIPGEGDPLSIAEHAKGYTRYDRRGVTSYRSGAVPTYNWIVRDCYVHDFGDNGIALGSHSDFILIENNIVVHCAYLTNNGNSGISCGWFERMDGVTPFPEFVGDYGLIIRNNLSIYNTNLRGFKGFNHQMTDGHGIILDTLTQDTGYDRRTLIEGNICYGNGARGINIYKSDHVDLIGNTCFDNTHTTRIPNPAYNVLFGPDGELGLQQSRDLALRNNILYARGRQGALSIQSSTEIRRSGNLLWNQEGEVPDAIPAGDMSIDPKVAKAVWLTQEQAELLATMSKPFDASSPSAQLRSWDKAMSSWARPDLRRDH